MIGNPIDQDEDDVVVKEGVDISIKDKEEMIQEQLSKDKIDELLIEADEINLEKNEAITQIVNVEESEKRFNMKAKQMIYLMNYYQQYLLQKELEKFY